ncbi:MAG TPA: NAD(P)/FAD-dependent oxidoreductase [Nitriliruptorales bacterium]
MSTAVVVGAGPNGLAAAVALARSGVEVTVFEAADRAGGGASTRELTLPGFAHDVCSAVHPFGASSPFLRGLPLEDHGLEWVHPEVCLAHPLDDGTAGVLYADLDRTCDELGPDGDAWRRTHGYLAAAWDGVTESLLGPLLRWPRRPFTLGRFGLDALRSTVGLCRTRFSTPHARALHAGSAAHAMTPLTSPTTAAMGIMLNAAAHGIGWPVARGGSQAIADALLSYLESMGGTVVTGVTVRRLEELPSADAVLLDLVPSQVLALAGDRLPSRARARYASWKHGPGAFKLDLALDGPVPWTAPGCARAGTVHLGGDLEEIARSEQAIADGRLAQRPFVLVGQQSVADPTRAPEGKHTLWAYAHVPNGHRGDVTEAMLDQVERFAPGFRDRILATSVRTPADLEAGNPNYVGGDIAGGAQGPVQLLRRMASPFPYRTPLRGVYLCGASTAPGAGVHGMCGYHAARCVLRDLRDPR